MTGETVVYRNEMNLVPLRKFTSTEIDIFFVLCNKLKEVDTNRINIPFSELKELSNYYTRSQDRFLKELEQIYDKMLNLTYTYRSGKNFEKFVLFTDYKVNSTDEYLSISINSNLKHILNKITSDFTKFELWEMTHLKSTYAKNMMRLLKQYKHTGYLKLKLSDFKDRLDIPKSYKMNDITKRVLKPIIKELVPLFPNLEINKIKAKKGRSIEYLEFTFDGEKRIHSKKQPYARKQKRKSSIVNREKTPKWLDNPNYQETTSKPDIDKSLEKDRERFLEQLKQNWDN
ncbi:RepB family plasmid replication initiator protein [Staphylococcus epidermidis]|uniref:replication initiation protein n=1 Tax=Bacillati TaxID=1783272 RepID=UPI000F404D3B|nr:MULTISPECIES: RepB family plasmid replication initiator protein [Staphylococcus]MBF2224132.1 RepB family plasmid replication initiator protein [Staphylococcus epidermidis]MBF2226493.1 RepB family plasmid replication initiator protein [Staphylococcus epidermidis]MCD9074595.1 RepB family plasmid replication initiator protein [Staphylococcus epidermidis]MCG1072437.1 RepB family plasmid replication initiator protein [Staphylococcus epidermidis]RNG64459.1 RepB family plasmid replication initiato